jgi:hypothetical protein
VKCSICHRPVTGGQEAQRRAEFRQQPDGSVKVFGPGMPGGPLALASGRLTEVRHNGCYWAAIKRERRAPR